MTDIDWKQLVADRDAGTRGPWVRDCWDILGKASRHGGGTGHVCEVSTPNGADDKYWQPGEDDANARRITRVPDIETYAIEAHKKLEAALELAEAADRYITNLIEGDFVSTTREQRYKDARAAWDAAQKTGATQDPTPAEPDRP